MIPLDICRPEDENVTAVGIRSNAHGSPAGYAHTEFLRKHMMTLALSPCSHHIDK